MSSCIDDRNCLSDQFCYPGNEESFCDCNFLRGHVLVEGKSLDDEGACVAFGRGAIFTTVLVSLELLAAFVLFLFVIYYYKYLNHELVYWSDANCKNLYLVTFGLLTFFFWRGVNIRILATAGDLPNIGRIRSDGLFERYHRLFGVEAAAVGLLTCCIAILVGNIGNMWLDKGLRIQFSTIEYEKKKVWLDRFRTAINFGVIILIPGYVVSFATNSFFAALGALVYLSLYALLLIYSFVKIRKLLMFCIDDSSDLTTLRAYKPSQRSQKLESELDKLEDYVQIFNITGFGLVVSYVTFLSGVMLFFILIFRQEGWKGVAGERKVNPVLISVEMVSISTLSFLSAAAYFCFASFRQLDNVKLRRRSNVNDEIEDLKEDPEPSTQLAESTEFSPEQPYSELRDSTDLNYTA